MRRTLRAMVVPVLLLTLLLAPAAASASVDTAVADDALILATEGGGEAPGLDPRGPDDPNNEFAPDNYEANFLWGAGVGILGLIVLLILTVGGLYYLLVIRPRQRADVGS